MAMTALTGTLGLAGCGEVSGLEAQARILAEPPCTDFFFPVYFADRSAEVPAAALRVIRNAGRQAQGCRGPAVEVVGLADPREPGAAPDLLRERARGLAAALAAAGLPPARFQASALGPAAPPSPRVDVFLRFQR
jgi:outer membrane protein OmpA-like peptidoglycan-associated protein